jgi:hypothetical protein
MSDHESKRAGQGFRVAGGCGGMRAFVVVRCGCCGLRAQDGKRAKSEGTIRLSIGASLQRARMQRRSSMIGEEIGLSVHESKRARCGMGVGGV